jgi:galactose-1-phosphate uridylyltransferase
MLYIAKMLDKKHNFDMREEDEISKLESAITLVKAKIMTLGPMRPGKLSRQYKDREARTGSYWQLNYTYQMKSRTEYVRTQSIRRIRKETATFREYKKLSEKWIDLELQLSQIRSGMEKFVGNA